MRGRTDGKRAKRLTGSGTRPDAKKGVEHGRTGQGGEETHLDTTGGHVELCSELIAEGSVGLCVALEDGLENLELGRGGAFAVLDLVGGVWVKGTKVDCSRVHGEEGGVDEGVELVWKHIIAQLEEKHRNRQERK